ncbi:hypothetical protein PsYK624_047800 [Phanerochaete sordida]|uniref:Uncharacterized protein n=1 Tax=Phanerochaete sordida TaxID=48140 RepID=A0A9P3G5Z4_9APHY|nr:hypothetical protein PsYK624_047800 [Phanerochaete sordida]
MSEDKAPLLPSETTSLSFTLEETRDEPFTLPADVDGWIDSFKKTERDHALLFAVLLGPFLVWWRFPAIQSSHALRIVAISVCALTASCLCISVTLYWRARGAACEGKAEQFMKDVLSFRYEPRRRESTLIINAPSHLFTFTMFLFMVEIIGYTWLSIPRPADMQIPAFDVIDALSLQVLATICGAIIGRSSKVIRKLGSDPDSALAISQGGAVDIVQEKV